MAHITRGTIPDGRIVDSLRKPNIGCIISYVGTVRDTSSTGDKALGIEFPASSDAEAKLTWIEEEARRLFDVEQVIIHHRIGRLKVTDMILVVAISAGHRQAAFASCKWIIDEVKRVHASWAVEELRT
jgi:molybdopterin synthase catalytic subunit